MDIINKSIINITVATRIGVRITYTDGTVENVTVDDLTEAINKLVANYKASVNYINNLHKDLSKLHDDIIELVKRIN